MSALALLKTAVEERGQKAVAQEIGYSPTVVSLMLKGSYKGDASAVEKAILIHLGKGAVNCPVLGQISGTECGEHQRRPLSTSNSHRTRMWRACRDCAFNTSRRKS